MNVKKDIVSILVYKKEKAGIQSNKAVLWEGNHRTPHTPIIDPYKSIIKLSDKPNHVLHHEKTCIVNIQASSLGQCPQLPSIL